MIDIDAVGTFTVCHEALKYLKKGGPGKDPSKGGLIINISATLHYTATWYQIHVSAAKVCYYIITLIIFGFLDETIDYVSVTRQQLIALQGA